MQHIGRMKDDRGIVILRQLFLRFLIGVIKLSCLIPADGHLVRHQRIQRHNLALAVADDLRIGVSPQQKMSHQCFPEHE